MGKTKVLVQVGKIEERILLIRGERVIIDADLAEFYGVQTKRLNEQVRRNKGRFPNDFMFQLTANEKTEVVAICDHLSKLKYSKSLPYAFTEHGAIMAASVLNSPRAVEVSVFIVRAFIKLRKAITEHKELYRKLEKIENRLAEHDEQILAVFAVIKKLIEDDEKPKKKIGYIKEHQAEFGKSRKKK
jgi:hypothetical protein